MSDFVRTYWVDNSDPDVTADELNRIEDGIVNGHAKADDITARLQEALDRAQQIIDLLVAHIARRDNPHQVTPSQLGVDVISNRLNSHLGDFNNPHKVTVDQAKAAS